ncbi:MAG: DUF1553 domain-containing protein [Phycisphaeraceae bacterium]
MRWFETTVTAGLALAIAVAVAGPVQAAEADEASFEAVAVIFENNCIRCHNAEGTMKGDLALSTYESLFGPEAAGVVRPGNADGSRLLAMISGPEPEMPRQSSPLSDEQVQTVRAWIDAGAPWPDRDRMLEDLGMPDADWWSFKPIEPVAVPEHEGADAAWVRNPIDAFVIDKLREQGLSPSPEADRRTLIRRIYYDLTGLPPSYEQVEAFVNDPDPKAYEKLVDKLLASPAYGERWARHWLDMAGYADTHGFDKDKTRNNAYHYRDYVVRSFNEGKPYERFIREQLAGDVLYPNTKDGVVATGFIVAGGWDFVGHVELREGTTDKDLTRSLDRDEMIDTVFGGLTSLTVACARCHTHKFDAIAHEDYYRMQAVFAGIERAPRPFPKDPQVAAKREQLIKQIADVEARLTELTEQVSTQGGGDLTQLRKKITSMVADRGGKGHASRGYHSDIVDDPATPGWVQVDLGEPTAIAHIVLAPTFDTFNNIGDGFGFPVRFKVELSNDADFAERVVVDDQSRTDFPNPGIVPHVATADGQKARYVRVSVNKRANRQDDYIFALAELAVLNAAGENVARGQAVQSDSSIEAANRWGRANLTNGIYEAMPAEEDADHLPALAEAVAREREITEELFDDAFRAKRQQLLDEIAALQQQREGLPEATGMVYAAATEFSSQGNFTPPPNGEPRPVHVLARGEVTQPGKEVGPGAIGALEHLDHHFQAIDDLSKEGQRRAAAAEWILDKDNPLTWRSIVNRIWHHHFGRGIVATLQDFGRMGEQPTHPQLLDYLALEFRDSDQSFKDLHRMIVTSATYRQASKVRSDMAALDSGNHYLWRMNVRKLEAEAIRDATMAVSGTLDREMYGPGYRLFGFIDDHSPHYLYDEHDVDNPDTLRRSIYRFIVRSVPDPLMETLDCADPAQNVHVRNSTLTALQALSLMNNPFMVRQSEHFAARLSGHADNPVEQIRRGFRLAYGRNPNRDEIELLMPIVQEHGLANFARLLYNANEMIFID